MSRRKGGCPCLHVTPCHPQCSCANPLMSYGCTRCCSYGSKEQQKEMAQWLAMVIDVEWEERMARERKESRDKT